MAAQHQNLHGGAHQLLKGQKIPTGFRDARAIFGDALTHIIRGGGWCKDQVWCEPLADHNWKSTKPSPLKWDVGPNGCCQRSAGPPEEARQELPAVSARPRRDQVPCVFPPWMLFLTAFPSGRGFVYLGTCCVLSHTFFFQADRTQLPLQGRVLRNSFFPPPSIGSK